MNDLEADLLIANAKIKQLEQQLAESQRREQAAVEDIPHNCEYCGNARRDGGCACLPDGDAFSPDYTEGFDRDNCEHWEWRGPEAGKGAGRINDNVSWLVTCPAGDQNFKNHLAGSSASEVKAAISKVEGQEKNKTKMKALLTALKRKQSAQAGEGGQDE